MALLICLILSASTADIKCIEMTAQLHKLGLLDPKKLSECSKKRLRKILRPAGKYKKNAKHLIRAAKIIHNQHNGSPPETFEELIQLPGVWRKTALLLLCEGMLVMMGIGSDIHVYQFALMHNLMEQSSSGSALTPEHAESLIRDLVDQRHQKDINRICGSFAQLFTQVLRKVEADNHEPMKAVVEAMSESIHMPHQVRLLWAMIAATREHYAAMKNKDNDNNKIRNKEKKEN
jgi:endonuclease III